MKLQIFLSISQRVHTIRAVRCYSCKFKTVKWCETPAGDVAPTFLLPAGGGGLNVSITIAEGCGVGIQGYVGAEG